jgi:SAM-dependent methyltransferase
MLIRFLKNALEGGTEHRPTAAPRRHPTAIEGRPSVLNVGGGSKDKFELPSHYIGFQHVLLDVDPRGEPDLLCDARELESFPAARYDAVYCSHNLEHYYAHDVGRVLRGFAHVVKEDGFCEVRVPDIRELMELVVQRRLDLDHAVLRVGEESLSVIDVVYGWGREIEESGEDFYAHKTGFSERTLGLSLTAAGFCETRRLPALAGYELRVVAFRKPPSKRQLELLGLSPE